MFLTCRKQLSSWHAKWLKFAVNTTRRLVIFCQYGCLSSLCDLIGGSNLYWISYWFKSCNLLNHRCYQPVKQVLCNTWCGRCCSIRVQKESCKWNMDFIRNCGTDPPLVAPICRMEDQFVGSWYGYLVLIYAEKLDSILGAVWLATQTPIALSYSLLSNERRFVPESSVIPAGINVLKSSFCVSFVSLFEYKLEQLFTSVSVGG